MSNYTKFPEFDNYNKLNQEELSNKTETGLSLKAFKEISNEIAMSTPWGENSTFHSKFQDQQDRERYLQKISSLMKKYCIEEFYYSNNPNDSSSSQVIIHLKKDGEKLQALLAKEKPKENKQTTAKNIENNKNIGIPITIPASYFNIKSNENWSIVTNQGVYSLPYNKAYYQNNISQQNLNVSSQELKQIYEDFIASESNMPECFDTNNYDDLVSKVQEQLSKTFYKNVNVAVNIKLLDANGNLVDGKDKTLQTNVNKPFDVKLNITVKQDGTADIKHIASENYMKQYVSKWQKEAEARGLEIDVEALRMQTFLMFQSQETEKSFYQKFIQETKALISDKVAGYVEGVQVSQKIAVNIWEQGTINQSTWLTKDPEYKEWPKYAQINPLVGGVTDGVVDEIVGIPLAVKGVYEIIADDEKQEALKNIFTKEGAKQMFNGLVSNAQETLGDEDKSQHFAGQTVVSVATMLSGVGFFTKAGKLDDLKELVEVATKKGDEFIDGASTLSKIDELKKLARHIDNDKAIDDLIKEFGTDTFEGHLDELIDAAKLVKDRKLVEVIKRWRLGRKLEANVTDRIVQELTELSGEYIEDVAQKMGKSVSELANMNRLTQLQIHLPKEELLKYAKKGTKLEDIKSTYIILDDVFIERVSTNKGFSFRLFANETKLSDLSPLTANQAAFQKMLQNGKVDFELRSIKDQVIDIFDNKRTVTMEKWIQTTGKGAEEADNLTTKILY